jgi:rare lipoprotein A
MRILSENSILNPQPRSADQTRRRARVRSFLGRTVSISTGLALGITLTVHGIHANRQPAAILTAPAAVMLPANLQKAKTAPRKAEDWHQIGLASWYGAQFQGKETANGERFDMNDLTCAHRSLPLGTWVKVTNLHTHKWVIARVNDRGPVPDTRITDLSSEAAHMLGMRDRGVTRVRLDIIDPRQAVEIARLEKVRLARLAAAAADAQSDSIPTGD